MNIQKLSFFRSRGRTRRRTRTKRGAPDTKTNSPSSAPTGSRPRSLVRPNERPSIILCLINIHFAPKTQGFFDPAVEPDAGREPNAAHRIQKQILRPLHQPARGLDLRSSKRTPPSFRVLCLMNIQKPSFSDPAVELDAGSEPDAAHRMQKRIPRPRRRPPRGPRPPVRPGERPQFASLKVTHNKGFDDSGPPTSR